MLLVLVAALWILRVLGALWRRTLWERGAEAMAATAVALGGEVRPRGPGFRVDGTTTRVRWRGGLWGPGTWITWRSPDGKKQGWRPGILDADAVARALPELGPPWYQRPLPPGWVAAIALGIVGGTAAGLTAMGRGLWCTCGTWSPWSWDIWSAHNSQHLVDPYAATHVLHGVVFFGVLWLLFRGAALRARADLRFLLAVALESAWELAENTDRVIEHYRETTISLDYYGDSVLNSVADVAMCAIGFWIASRLPWWASVLLFVAVEVVLALTIHDSLVLNVIMLLWPLEAIKQWQMSAAP